MGLAILGCGHVSFRLEKVQTMSQYERRDQSIKQSLGRESYASSASPSEFAAFAAHEFRSPIHTLQAFLSILLREQPGPINEIQRDFLSSMLFITRRMERLTDDIRLVLAEGEQFPINTQSVDLVSLVEDCRRELAPVADGFKVDIGVVYAPDLNQEIESDPIRLAQITINLLENAIRHAVEGSTVHVRVRQSHTRVLLVVENEAVNPPDVGIEEWFVPFMRDPSARERFPQGLGLGLPIVSQLVAALDGRIMTRADNPLVTIAVCLPRHRPSDVQA